MRRSDIYTGIVLALVGLATIFVVIPEGISVSDEYGLSPRIFPLTVMWLGTVVALILVVQRLREGVPPGEDPAPMRAKNWLFIAAISAYLAATYYGIATIGFKIAGPISVAVMMAVMGEYRYPVRLVLVSLTLPLAVYFAFERLFIIQLP